MISSPSDIYAIGVGNLDVDWRELNELGSKKDGERHAFILKDVKALSQVFEHMLGECASPPPERCGQCGAGQGHRSQCPSPASFTICSSHPQMSPSSRTPSVG